MANTPALKLRLDSQRKARWQQEAKARGEALSEFIINRVDHGDGNIEEKRRELAKLRRSINELKIRLSDSAAAISQEDPDALEIAQRELDELVRLRQRLTEELHR